MKKVFYLLVSSLFILSVLSCTPQTIIGDSDATQACCGDDLNIPPRPPKPPIGG